MSRTAPGGRVAATEAPDSPDAPLFAALARVAQAESLEAAADVACEAVVARGRWGRAAFVYVLPHGLVFGSAGLSDAEKEMLRTNLGRFGPVERSTNRLFVLESYRIVPGVDVAFIPVERRARLASMQLRAPQGRGTAGERWEPEDELVLLPHTEQGASLGTLALSAPADGRRPGPDALPDLRALLAFAGAVGALLRARDRAVESGREQSRRVLDYVQSLANLDDVETLLDRVAEICARLAGFHVGVLTAHMEDGAHVGAWNLPPEERAAFWKNSRGSTLEGTAGKRARIRAMAFPGTGIAYVPHDADLSRSHAFVAGKTMPGGTWHAEDRLFVLLRTTQGRDIGVLSLDEPGDGRAPTASSLGALRVAERFLDLCGALLETRLLRAQVERTQRLEAVGTLVAGIAHDFNNVLGAIMGYASLLRVQLPPDSELTSTVRVLEESCERAAGLTRRLRALTQAAPTQKQSLDVAALVADAAKVARDTFVPRLTVETDLKPGLPPVMGDAGALSRALLNLCINARDAQRDGGRMTLRAYAETPPEGGAPTAVRIEVEDDGPGLSPSARQHLFEPFFTTKPHGKGTGLGLFSAWSTARGHGGSLEAVERRETGALFRLRLPAAGAPVRKPDPAAVANPAERRRVFVVEDESPIQDLIRHGLEMLGHHVEAVWDGQEAIDVLERRAGDFDLVILDLLLPRRSGTEVFHVLRGLRQDLPRDPLQRERRGGAARRRHEGGRGRHARQAVDRAPPPRGRAAGAGGGSAEAGEVGRGAGGAGPACVRVRRARARQVAGERS